MPRKTELTWQSGAANRQGRWRKKYKGRVIYFPFGRSKSDLNGYKQALEAWKLKKQEIDGEESIRPKLHQVDYEKAIENWTLVLQWSLENNHAEYAQQARIRLDDLKQRLNDANPRSLGFYDQYESLYAYPPELLEHLASLIQERPSVPPNPKLKTTVVPSQKAIDSFDMFAPTRTQVQAAVWRDRLESQRNKSSDTKATIAAQVDAFLATKRQQVDAGHLSAGRYDPLRIHLYHLRDWLGPTLPVASIGGKVIKNYHTALLEGIAKGKWSSHYAYDRMSALKNFIRWLWRTEAINELPRILDSKNEDLKISKGIVNPPVFKIDEIKALLNAATDRTKLYLLLMLNTGMTQKDISDLRPNEVNWQQGTITRKRSKTARHENVPTVTYRLWRETFRLLCQERAQGASTVLVNSEGGTLKVENLDAGGKLSKIDNVVSAFSRLKRRVKIKKPLKLIRKTSATLLKSDKKFPGVEVVFLGHSPRSIADRHYAQVPQALLDEAIKWLGKQYGVK